MFDAKFYAKHFTLQRSHSIAFLKRSGGLITISPNDVLIDIGCGPGDVTTQVLVPAISNKFKKLYGIDHSVGMIDYAKQYNSSDKRLEYLVVDIGSANAVKHLIEKANHIYSFFCFMWIKDQKQLFANLYDMLLPNGDILVISVISSVIWQVWGVFKSSEKWGRFLRNAEIPYLGQNKKDTASNFTCNLEKAGFSYIFSVKEDYFTYESDEEYRAAMKAISPWLDSIPNNLHSEIMDEFMVESAKYNEQTIKLNKNIASRTCSLTIVEIFARKPL